MDRKTHKRLYREFLAKLIQARKEVKLSQVDAAKLLGKHQSYISKCESAERRVDIVELQIFASIYQKPLSFFEIDLPIKQEPFLHSIINKKL